MGIYVITGGTTGIGAATRDHLHRQGHRTVNLDLKAGDHSVDLSNPEQYTPVLHEVAEAHPEIDGIVTCAGVASHFPDTGKILDINFWGTVNVVEALRGNLSEGSRVVVISSNSAPQCSKPELVEAMLANDREAALNLATECSGHDCYSGSKHAIARWVRREAPQFARQGIALNAIAPGYIETPMTQAVAQSEEYGEAIKQFVASIPLGRPGTPQDIASLIGFLLSPEAHFIAGSLVYADGGHDALFRPNHGP